MFGFLLDLYTVVGFYILAFYSIIVEFYMDRIRKYYGQSYIDYLQTMTKNSAFVNTEDEDRERYALITGGNGTIGRELVKGVLELGFKVICLNREEDKFCEMPHSEDIIVKYINLTDLKRVKRVAQEISSQFSTIDLIICNAGVLLTPYNTTEDGFETHYAVNLLSHAILVENLIRTRRNAKWDSYDDDDCFEMRIAFVSSITAHLGDLNRRPIDDNSFFKYYSNGYHAYSTSKLAVSVYARMLHSETENNWLIKIISLHPGVVSSNLYRNANFLTRSLINGPLRSIMRSPVISAAEILACICSNTLEGGYYYQHMRPVKLLSAKDKALQKKLYQNVQRIVQNL